jgi:integrase
MNSEVREILLLLCKRKRPDDNVWLFPKTGKPFDDIKKAFISACEDAGIEGLVWHGLRALWHEVRRGRLQRIRYHQLMGHANISTSQRYVRNLPVGAGEAVMLKNQRRHNTVTSEVSATLMVAVNS